MAWIDHPYSALSGSNQNCSLHHILGRKVENADSIFNSIMLSSQEHKEADGHNIRKGKVDHYQYNLFKHSIPIIFKSGYQIKERDMKFLESIQDTLQDILKDI